VYTYVTLCYEQVENKENKVARGNRKRLAVDLPVVIHDALTEIAIRYNVTITGIVTELVYKFVTDDEILNRGQDELG